MSWQTRLQHWQLAVGCLPTLLSQSSQRSLLAEMRQLCRQLPALLEQPIPEAMAELTPNGDKRPLPNEATTRHLSDLAALLERRSPLGLCLRRSLVRYHYLRQLDVPVTVHFGAKFVPGQSQRQVTGHAWLMRDGRPYYEAEENWRDFTLMFTWPPQGET